MSDILFYDAAVCWIEDNEAHATFHRSCKLGSQSLALWRFVNCMQCQSKCDGCKCCLSFLDKCFEESRSWNCNWCGEDQHACNCEVDANGLVWDRNGVGIPFQDCDLPF